MTDNTKMVDLPWVDGTTRTVPEGAPYERLDGVLAYARKGGYSHLRGAGVTCRDHNVNSQAVRILTEAPEPPVKVKVPTGIGAIVSLPNDKRRPGFVHDWKGWRGLGLGKRYEVSEIADELRDGAVVLYAGVDE